MLPLELQLLRALQDLPEQDSYGASLARFLRGSEGGSLLGHGTLYKALDRMERAGLITSQWEVGDSTELQRPLRRLYRCTGVGVRASAPTAPRTRADGKPRLAAT